jgi:signal transduction histidine kinase/DNA-binding response OmpR family regulator
MPVVFEGQVKAVIELASFERFTPAHQAFLDQLTESIGIVLNTIEANMRTEELLKNSQSLTRELQSRGDQLEQANAELEERSKLLADQNAEVERKNREVEQARQALEDKAKQLALTSKYKSEFLANMSHELRTPLNSLLILSDQLSKNPEGNLTGRQVEFAKTIHSSGNDLLALINDILDLSKIESGTVIVDVGDVGIRDLTDYVDRTFRHVAENKKLEFNVDVQPHLPRSLHTDAKRLQQILKNLLSNAFKFTDRGRVTLAIEQVESGWNSENESLNRAKSVIAFSVQDTGIGIPADKQAIIFEAFQQADGSTSRKYGGTGLGLAISREISKLLGGEIKLSSVPNQGSIFTLYLPQAYLAPARPRRQVANEAQQQALPPAIAEASPRVSDYEAVPVNLITDDSANIQPGDKVLLIVENDLNFARVVMDVAREKGFKALVAGRGSNGLAMAREHKPSAITLDINLPDIDGWRVLDRLKDDPTTRHIPVHVITTEDEHARPLRMGAMGALTKPLKTREALDEAFDRIGRYLAPPVRRIVLAHHNPDAAAQLGALLAGDDAEIHAVTSGEAALATVRENRPDLLIIDASLPEMKGFDLVEEIAQQPDWAELPLIVFTDKELTKKEEMQLKRLSQTMVLKDVRSAERLFDEVALFLHRRVSTMPEDRRALIEQLHQNHSVVQGKKVLIVDDDIRNIFAMTSILERYNMNILSAETGKSAIETLQSTPDIDVVLMDIMMPDMDGYDTMRAIRKLAKFRSLPIIALTAKAMKGDREKCIEAGASDYIAKPVDTEQLMGLLRVWLHR